MATETNGSVANSSTLSPTSSQSSSFEIEKRQTYKMKKEKYHSEKRRAAEELINTFKDPTIVVMADWLKIRGTLRTWTKMYCVLKPGLLLIYKSPKTHKYGYWIGTVLLSSCELIERPSKRDGFCFKLFHPLDQSIWATRGPQGESFGAVTQPLPGSYLICRASCEQAGRCWMDGLELSLKCSSLLMRTMNKLQQDACALDASKVTSSAAVSRQSSKKSSNSVVDVLTCSKTDLAESFEEKMLTPSHEEKSRRLSASEAERHFCDAGLGETTYSETEDDVSTAVPEDIAEVETPYELSPPEVFGDIGESEQTEEVADENKSLIWTLMKQLRPGMDLSKVVLPTFILEPRSFLEKLADYYYHADFLTKAVNEDDPFKRMKAIVRFYLSGFYKKPKGLKKPYNPVLGEKFRCCFEHPADKSRTFYVAEQVSHHPPVSAIYVSNRKAGFNVSCSILARSKFYGNSLSAILAGTARITLLNRGESYLITLPYAHCKGLLLGTLTMELGGSVSIFCDRTSYSAEIEFKLKPFLSGSDAINLCTGKIKLGKETLADLSGHWDSAVNITDRQTGQTEVFWQPTSEVISSRLQRSQVPLALQQGNESQKLWLKVTEAIKNNDQFAATDQKTCIEEEQRQKVKERLQTGQQHEPSLFDLDGNSGNWVYKYSDYRPWDKQNDLEQFERDFIIKTRMRHPAPLVRTNSLEVSDLADLDQTDNVSRTSEEEIALAALPSGSLKRKNLKRPSLRSIQNLNAKQLEIVLKPVKSDMENLRVKLDSLLSKVDRNAQMVSQSSDSTKTHLLIVLAILVAIQAVIVFFFSGSKTTLI